MDTAFDMFKSACPSRQVLDRVADRWTALVLLALSEGTMRFSELRRRIEGVSQKMLTQTLRGLERDGLAVREVFPTVPVTVQYTLTPLGESLLEAVQAIRSWAYRNIDEIDRARERYDAAAQPATMDR